MKNTSYIFLALVFAMMIAGLSFQCAIPDAKATTVTFDHYTTGSVITPTVLNTNILARVKTAVDALDTTDGTKTADTVFKSYTASANGRIHTKSAFATYSASRQTALGLKANAASPALTGTGTFVNMSGTGYMKILNGYLVIKGINGTWYRLKATGAGFGKISTVAY
jgi:hypothetical protein